MPTSAPEGKEQAVALEKGHGRKRNPRRRDGQVITCRACISEEHFAARCPQGKGGGKKEHDHLDSLQQLVMWWKAVRLQAISLGMDSKRIQKMKDPWH